MKRRWLYRAGQEPVEVTAEWTPTPCVQIVPDAHYDGLRAIDGADISSRRKHQEYMKRNGYALAGDFKETIAKAQKERASPSFDSKARREVIGRAVYQKWKP